MSKSPFIVKEISTLAEGVFRLILTPKNSDEAYSFLPGQYAYVQNPTWSDPNEVRPFSLASPPHSKDIEFCIKPYGDWTKALLDKRKSETVFVSDPNGTLIFDETYNRIVFLCGSTGIAPVMSILRSLDVRPHISLRLLYGNRTTETIAYKKELETFEETLKDFRVIHVLSHLPQDHSWQGYRGFITREILVKEIDLSLKPTFFLIGPPVFTDLMEKLLSELDINPQSIKKERY